MKLAALIFLTGALVTSAEAAEPAEPAKTIDAYVTPYYFSAPAPNEMPQISVARSFDAALADGSVAQLKAVADQIKVDPEMITPMTMMVLAIRMYDAGMRDDAVFWFYVAKERYLTAERVLDFSHSALAEVSSAVASFATLAGPYINGYAFCDVSRQQSIRSKAVEWVAAHPYAATQIAALPAKPGDRQENLALAMREMRERARAETKYVTAPTFQAELAAARKGSEADVRYCWK